MKNPAGLLGAAVALVAVGFAAGLLVGRQRAVEEGRRSPPGSDPSASHSPDPLAPPSSSTAPEAAEQAKEKLRERIFELEAELRVLREDGAKSSAADAGVGGEVARQAYEDMLALQSGELDDPERLRSLIIRLSQIDPKLARHFIDKYRALSAAGGAETDRFVALQLAMMSGGPDAADFLQQLLTDPGLVGSLRNRLLDELSPTGTGFFSIRRLPVGDSLGSTAMTLVRSDKAEDRKGGAGLLGGTPTLAARGELARLLAADPDSGVRQVAARSLGLIGDASSRNFLETYAAQTADARLQKAAAAAIKELDRAPR